MWTSGFHWFSTPTYLNPHKKLLWKAERKSVRSNKIHIEGSKMFKRRYFSITWSFGYNPSFIYSQTFLKSIIPSTPNSDHWMFSLSLFFPGPQHFQRIWLIFMTFSIPFSILFIFSFHFSQPWYKQTFSLIYYLFVSHKVCEFLLANHFGTSWLHGTVSFYFSPELT